MKAPHPALRATLSPHAGRGALEGEALASIHNRDPFSPREGRRCRRRLRGCHVRVAYSGTRAEPIPEAADGEQDLRRVGIALDLLADAADVDGHALVRAEL